MLEGPPVAEEARVLGQHGVHDLIVQRCPAVAQAFHQFGQCLELKVADQGRETVFQKIVLVAREHEAGALAQKMGDEIEIRAVHHRSSMSWNFDCTISLSKGLMMYSSAPLA